MHSFEVSAADVGEDHRALVERLFARDVYHLVREWMFLAKIYTPSSSVGHGIGMIGCRELFQAWSKIPQPADDAGNERAGVAVLDPVDRILNQFRCHACTRNRLSDVSGALR